MRAIHVAFLGSWLACTTAPTTPLPQPSCLSDATTHVLASVEQSLTLRATVADPKVAAMLRAYARPNVHVIVTSGDDNKLALSYGSQTRELRIRDAVGAEFWITSTIREIVSAATERPIRIGFVAGHGELSFREPNLVPYSAGKPTLEEILHTNFPVFKIEPVGLDHIDPALAGLVVLQPAADWSEADMRAIDDFVMTGKPLVVFASAVNVARGDRTMSASLDLHGVDKLMEGYGVEIHKDVVFDFDGELAIQVRSQTGDVLPLRLPQVVSVRDERMDHLFAPFSRMDVLQLPLVSSITIHPERQPSAKLRVVAKTSEHAARETESPVDVSPFRTWHPRDFGQFDLGVVLHGEIASPFSHARHDARIFVIASAQATANPLARAGNAEPNGDERLLALAEPYANMHHGDAPLFASILLVKNTLDWIVNPPELSDLASKSTTCAP